MDRGRAPAPGIRIGLPELGGPASRYAIFRRDADGARKDVLSWGEAAGSGPYVMLEVYRPGAPGDRLIDPAERDRRAPHRLDRHR